MKSILIIAHGSRRPEANADAENLAKEILRRGEYDDTQHAFLELASPTIEEGARSCVARGAKSVVMVPYFLSAGVHVREDLAAARDHLAAEFPNVRFTLAEPLGLHPGIVDIILERARAAGG